MGLAQRIKKLESTLGLSKRPVADDAEIELTDEEWADWMGDFLWWPKGADLDRWPGYFASTATHCDGPLGAWQEATLSAWREGHTDYHVGLRPYALAVWLQWKPSLLKHGRTHGDWIWDVPPRINSVSSVDFERLPTEEQCDLLREPGKGHWSKDPDFKKCHSGRFRFESAS